MCFVNWRLTPLCFRGFLCVVLAVQEDTQPDITDGYCEVAGIFHFGFYLTELNVVSVTHCLVCAVIMIIEDHRRTAFDAADDGNRIAI